MNKIDLIVPAYNAHDTIDRLIGSVIMQTIRDQIKVTIADDSSTAGNYDAIVERYKPLIDIQTMRLPVNSGPGVARQYAMDRTNGEYIIFSDADDTFANAFVFETYAAVMDTNKDACATFAQFYEETNSGFLPHPKDATWMHGKCYRRSFIELHNVRFHESSRANEDAGFNAIVKLVAEAYNQRILSINENTYFWHYSDATITRRNNGEYYFAASYSGYVENMIYALSSVEKMIQKAPNKKEAMSDLRLYAAQVMCYLYTYLLETETKCHDRYNANYEQAKLFYKTIYSKVAKDVPYNDFAEVFGRQMTAFYKKNQDLIPTVTFFDFISDLKKG